MKKNHAISRKGLKIKTVIFVIGWLMVSAVQSNASESKGTEIVVYSARMEQLIKPVFDAYTKATGVAIKFLTDKEGPLLQRLIAEGADSPADLFLTVDAGMLWKATEEKVLKPIQSPALLANIPAHLRDPGNHWFGLSVRARTIVFHNQRVKQNTLSTYEALGDPQWKKKLCLRTANKIYNQSMVAMMISELGMEVTEKVVRSWVDNLATPVFSDDTKVMEAIEAGICDVGLVNTYYYGRLLEKNPKLPLSLFWPNQNGRGVHVNVSGAGVVRHAKHEKEAIKLLEWLSGKEAQNLFADSNLEYPANPQVAPHPTVARWGTFKQDEINVSVAGKLQVEAVKLMDRAGYK